MTKEDLAEMVDDDLAAAALDIKRQLNELRSGLYLIEAEILKRMQARNARALLGEQYRVKSSLKRDITWDQDALIMAQAAARDEGLELQFHLAFPRKFDCSLRGLKALESYGGTTWEMVQKAKERESEKLSFEYESL